MNNNNTNNDAARDAGQNDDSLPYQYFSATLCGWNGSRKREIVTVSGCWDDEAEALAALDAACEKKREAYADGNGLAYDDETLDDRFRGWLGDYQRITTEFSVTPSDPNDEVSGRGLLHEKMETIAPGEVPTFA